MNHASRQVGGASFASDLVSQRERDLLALTVRLLGHDNGGRSSHRRLASSHLVVEKAVAAAARAFRCVTALPRFGSRFQGRRSGSSRPVTVRRSRSAQGLERPSGAGRGRRTGQVPRRGSRPVVTIHRLATVDIPAPLRRRSGSRRSPSGRSPFSEFLQERFSRVIDLSSGFGACVRCRRRTAWSACRRRRVCRCTGRPQMNWTLASVSAAWSMRESRSRVLVPQQQLAAIAVVAVDHVNPRLAEIGQAEQQPLLDLLELARLDHVLPRLLLVGVREHLVLRRRTPGVRKVSMKVISLWTRRTSKIFLPAQSELFVPVALLLQIVAFVVFLAELPRVPALLDVAQQLDAELVRIEPARAAVAIVPEWWSA